MGRPKQKGNGTGTVFPRKNKNGKIIGYRGAYFAPDGKRRYVSAKRKGDAERTLRQAMSDADRGLVFDAGTLTLGEYLDGWLENIRGTVRQRSWERYEQLVRVHIKPALGRKRLKDLTRAHAKGLYGEKRKYRSPGTVRYIHVTLHKALKDAVTDGLLSKNVADGIKPSKPKRVEFHPLNPEQAKAFLDVAREDRFYALYVVAVRYGLRQGELLGLKWEDIDLEAGTLQVRRTLSQTRTGPVEEETKSGKGRRIELHRTVTEVLASHRKRQRQEMEAVGDGYQDKGLVFASVKGTPVNSSNLCYRSFKPLLERIGLEIRFHDLRHSCATIRFMKRQHPKAVQEMLGHSSVAITLDIYSHVIPGSNRGDDDVMEEALS